MEEVKEDKAVEQKDQRQCGVKSQEEEKQELLRNTQIYLSSQDEKQVNHESLNKILKRTLQNKVLLLLTFKVIYDIIYMSKIFEILSLRLLKIKRVSVLQKNKNMNQQQAIKMANKANAIFKKTKLNYQAQTISKIEKRFTTNLVVPEDCEVWYVVIFTK